MATTIVKRWRERANNDILSQRIVITGYSGIAVLYCFPSHFSHPRIKFIFLNSHGIVDVGTENMEYKIGNNYTVFLALKTLFKGNKLKLKI